jgi:hypothetical protein
MIDLVTVLDFDGSTVRFTVPGRSEVLGCSASLDTMAEDVVAYLENPNPIPPVPSSLSPAQLRLALTGFGWRDEVEALVSNPLTPQDVRDNYEYRLDVQRDYPLLVLIGQQLGKTDEEIDELFRYGATL